MFNGFIKTILPFLNINVTRDINSQPTSFSFNLWHARLGHISPQYLRGTQKLTADLTDLDENEFCEACAIICSTRLLFGGGNPLTWFAA